jgi:hypothetical protein
VAGGSGVYYFQHHFDSNYQIRRNDKALAFTNDNSGSEVGVLADNPGGQLFLSRQDVGTISRVELNTITKVVDAQVGITALAADDTMLYWIRMVAPNPFPGYEVRRAPKAGGPSTLLFTKPPGASFAEELKVRGDYLYWKEYGKIFRLHK